MPDLSVEQIKSHIAAALCLLDAICSEIDLNADGKKVNVIASDIEMLPACAKSEFAAKIPHYTSAEHDVGPIVADAGRVARLRNTQ